MKTQISVRAIKKIFKEEFIELTLRAHIKLSDYAFIYSEYIDKLNKIYSELEITIEKDMQVFNFEMPFDIPYEEFFGKDYDEVGKREMNNFIDLLEPIIKALIDKENTKKLFDDNKKPNSLTQMINID